MRAAMAYVDTHRGLMMWDPSRPSEKPTPLHTDFSMHHAPALSIAPIEGGLFMALPCDADHHGHIPHREEVLRAAVDAIPRGKLVHVNPSLNVSTVIASDLHWPTGIAVPYGEDLALILEPLAYRVRQVSLDGFTLGMVKPFLWDLPAFPCAVAPASHLQPIPDFWIALCGPSRHPLLETLHRHPLLKNILGYLPSLEVVSAIFQTPTPNGHLMLARVTKGGRIMEVLCDEEDGIVPQANFLLQHADHFYVGGHEYPYLVMTNRTKRAILPRPQHLHDGEL